MMLNPILERELKSKMRTWKSPIAIIIYLFFIGLITYTAMIILSSGRGGFNPKAAVDVFDFISIFQLILIMFIIPMITGGSISGERERQTLDLMLCTDTPSISIILGKIFSGLSTLLLLVVMATPFLSISFILGGIGIFDVFKMIVYYVVTGFYISTIALYTSCKFKRNVTSILMTYVIMGVLYITPFILMIGVTVNASENVFLQDLLTSESYPISALFFGANPGYGMLSLISNSDNFTRNLSSSAMPFITDIPLWVISIIWFAIISAIMLWLANRNLKAKE